MASQYPQIETISDILEKYNYTFQENDKFNKQQIDKLLKLKLGKKELLSLKDRPLLYDILGLLNYMGFEDAYEYLKKNQKEENGYSIVKNSPPYNEAKRRYFLDITEQLRAENNIIDGIYDCPKCSSKKVTTELKQTRRADEAMTVINTCTNCGFLWKN